MIWTIVILIVGYIAIRFFIDLNKDNDDLQGQSLNQKFSIIVNILNNKAFNNRGKITNIDKREFNLYETGQNQIIKFSYGTGHLTLEWRYKYFQKETIYKHQYMNVRNLSIFEQEKIANHFIKEALFSFEKHKLDVIKDSSNISESIDIKGVNNGQYANSPEDQVAAAMYLLMLLCATDHFNDRKLSHIANIAKELNFNLEGKSMEIYAHKTAEYAYYIVRLSSESLKSLLSFHLLTIIKMSEEATEAEWTLFERIISECEISEETFNRLNTKRLD